MRVNAGFMRVVGLVLVVVLALVVSLFILSLHGGVRSVKASASGSFSAPSVSNPSLLPSLSGLPVYVVGPSGFVASVVPWLPNATIRSIGLSGLASLPSNSIVIIDWDYIKPYLMAHGELNTSSTAFRELASLFSRGDFIALYGNPNDYAEMALTLELAWAKGTGTRLNVQGLLDYRNQRKSSLAFYYENYVLAIPMLPIPRNEPIIVLAYGGHGWIAIAPTIINNLMRFVIPYEAMRNGLSIVRTTSANPSYDPCWYEWDSQFSSASEENGNFVTNNSTMLWLAPEWGGSGGSGYKAGLEAYSDGNGTFYIDSCIIVANYANLYKNNYLILDAEVLNWLGYYTTDTLINNGGYVSWQLGGFDYYTSYNDYLTGQSSAYFVSFYGSSGVQPQPMEGVEIGPTLEYSMMLPLGSTESISLINSPSITVSIPTGTPDAGNFTWIFNIANRSQANQVYGNAFNDPIQDGTIVIPNYNPGDTYAAYLPVNFENYVITQDLPYSCATYELMWTNVVWEVVVTTNSQVNSNTYLLNLSGGSSIVGGNAPPPPNSYLTGLESGIITCNVVAPP